MFIEYNNIISDRRIYVKKFVIRCRRSASFSGGLDLVLRLIFLKMAEGNALSCRAFPLPEQSTGLLRDSPIAERFV